MKRLLSLVDLGDAEIRDLLARARRIEASPISEDLKGKVLALLFMNPSVRTLASFQAGMAQLGGSSVVISPGSSSWAMEWQTGAVMDGAPAEHLREAVPVLEEYADALGVRCFAGGQDLQQDLADPVIQSIAELARKPLINLESATSHPCQALADWKTLDDLGVPEHGGKIVLSWAWHPRPLPLAVPNSVLGMAVKRGMDITVLRPEGFALPRQQMVTANEIAEETGACLRETSDAGEALEGAHVLYAKSWQAPSAYGDTTAEAALRAPLREAWCVDDSWFDTTRSDARFMHCLPVRRNVVVADEVLDGPRSAVVTQAGNRLHVQKAVLSTMLGTH